MTPHYSKWFGQNYVIRAHVILNASLRIHFSARIIAIHITVWHALKWKKITLKQSGLFLFSEKTIIHVDELDVFWHNLRHKGIYIIFFKPVLYLQCVLLGERWKTRCGLDGPGFRAPVKARDFSSPKSPYRFWGPASLLFNGYRLSFPGGKVAGEWSKPIASFYCCG